MIKLFARNNAMDPGEDIIDVLYKCRDTKKQQRDTLFRLPSFTRDPNQWPPPITPTYRNYEEDLHRLRRRSLDRCNSWRGDSVYTLKPQLTRTDTRFPPGPRSAPAGLFEQGQRKRQQIPPNWIEESVDESEILWNNSRTKERGLCDDFLLTDEYSDDPFLTPLSEDNQFVPSRSICVDVVPQAEDTSLFSRRNHDLIELPNGARQLRRRILPDGDGENYSGQTNYSDTASGHYGSLSSRGVYSSQHYFPEKESNTRQETFSRSDSRSSLGGGGLYSSIASINLIAQMGPPTSADPPGPQIPNSSPRKMAFLFEPQLRPLLKGANNVIGILVMLVLANKWSNYLQTLHENELWFSNIKEVEREISFRTEQGLYYSYFKHLVNSPSLLEGKAALEQDNLTEHLNTINIFQRFNIHQELFLASLYRIYNFRLEPIFFYMEAVFSLQGFLFSAFFLIAWQLSGTWLAGVLTSAFIVCNRLDITRVEFTVSLREHFSLPFIFAQFFAVSYFFQEFQNTKQQKHSAISRNQLQKIHLILIYVLTFLFNITWQFSQFVLLIQALVLHGLGSISILNRNQVCQILVVQLLSLLTVWYLQFYQSMVLTSLVVYFIPVAIVSLQCQIVTPDRQTGLEKVLFSAVVRILTTLLAAIGLSSAAKFGLRQDDDNHIFEFVKSKLGFVEASSFELRMYRCLPAFQAIDYRFYVKMCENLLLPIYLSYVISRLVLTLTTVAKRRQSGLACHDAAKKKDDDYEQKRDSVAPKQPPIPNVKKEVKELSNSFHCMDKKPEQCIHTCLSMILGMMAMSTLRMKCFWTPYMCIIASVAICDKDLWNFVTEKITGSIKDCQEQTANNKKSDIFKPNKIISFIFRHCALLIVILILFQNHKDKINKEIEDLKEFWDPDTVDLMEWIQASTPTNAAFTGSMQLLAGVRLSTWRPITNHPHFEDKNLRERTKELYSIYAKKSPEEVHQVLSKYNSSYIVLEDSICLQAGRHKDRCSLPDIMDLTFRHIPDDGILDPPNLVSSPYPRFCLEIRYGSSEYSSLFRKVFENKTFRVYQVIPKH